MSSDSQPSETEVLAGQVDVDRACAAAVNLLAIQHKKLGMWRVYVSLKSQAGVSFCLSKDVPQCTVHACKKPLGCHFVPPIFTTAYQVATPGVAMLLPGLCNDMYRTRTPYNHSNHACVEGFPNSPLYCMATSFIMHANISSPSFANSAPKPAPGSTLR